jgi:hypothetical protein
VHHDCPLSSSSYRDYVRMPAEVKAVGRTAAGNPGWALARPLVGLVEQPRGSRCVANLEVTGCHGRAALPHRPRGRGHYRTGCLDRATGLIVSSVVWSKWPNVLGYGEPNGISSPAVHRWIR